LTHWHDGIDGTETIDPITAVGTDDGTFEYSMTTTDGESGMVTTYLIGTLETYETGTTTGETQVVGTTLVGTGTVETTTVTVPISVAGTDDGTYTVSMITTDGYDGMVIMLLDGTAETKVAATMTGETQVDGTRVGSTVMVETTVTMVGTLTDDGMIETTEAGIEATEKVTTVTVDGKAETGTWISVDGMVDG
jgi:hypothetical protein